MNWSTPADLRAQVQKWWDRGELLSSLVTGESLFPRRLSLKGPTSAEMADQFDQVRAWIGAIREMRHCRIEMREVRNRVIGANALPQEVWIESPLDAFALIGKQSGAALFAGVVETTREREPKLLAWLAQRPLRALALSDDWSKFLEIVAWLKLHPRPGVYLRQVDIPGVHSKFIEAHRSVLMELLDLALLSEEIDSTRSGVSQFAQRYGFLDKPVRIRFRVLDPELAVLGPSTGQDVTLDAASFARLDAKGLRIFITENEINFLALPQIQNSLVIFGAGYGFEMLRQAEWLMRCRVHYWGDIDTHGFAILDQLRGQFDHVESFLMDRATLMAFESLWGEEEKQTLRDLPRLNLDERALHDDLRDNRIRKNLRLEQERIGFGWVKSALSTLT